MFSRAIRLSVNFCEKKILRIVHFATARFWDRLEIHKNQKGPKKFMSFSDCFRLQSYSSLETAASWIKVLQR